MRRLFLPVLVLVPATVAILFFFSEGLSGNRMTLAGPDKAATRPAEHRAPLGDRSGLIDFGAGRGTDLFSAEPRTVVIEALDGVSVVVTSGLQPGDRVATQGASLLNQVR